MDWLTIVIATVLAILGFYYLFGGNSNKFEKLGIPHIKPWPVFGNLAPAIFRICPMAEAVDRAYRLRDDAEYVGFYDMNEPVILIRSPELIKDITVKHFDHFVDRRSFVDADLDPMFGKNLAALRGEKWKEIRRLLTPAFTTKKLRGMFELMSDCGKMFTNYLVERATSEAYVFNAKEAFTRYTNDVIATCAFGITVDSMKNPDNDFYVMGRDATNFEGLRSVKLFAVRSFPKISRFFKLTIMSPKTQKFFENIVRETIATRDRDGINRPDMIQLMMETRENKTGKGPELSFLDMTAQAFVFFFGGFDSTSTSLCFAAHEIAVNEDVQKRLHEEIDAVTMRTNGEVTYEAINEMEYLDAVVNEALRKYPIGTFLDRICVKSFELPPAFPGAVPVTIEPGENIWISTYSVQRDSKYYPNPDKFDPERFMGTRKNDVDPFTFLTFGHGPRMCIGNRFALLEIKVVLFHLLTKCHLKPSSKTMVPLELSKSGLTMTAQGGFWLQLEIRNGSSTM